MKSTLLLCLAGLVCSETALAADLPAALPYKAPAQVSDWTGFYLGAGLGFRSAETDVNVNSAQNTTAPPVLTDPFLASDCYIGFPCVRGQQFNGTSLRFSPYLGYNRQVGERWVLGIEADAGIGNQSTTVAGAYYPATPFFSGSSFSNSFSVKTGWDASLRGRVGYLVQPGLMVYATGGPAWIDVESTSDCSTLASADGACVPAFSGLSPASITHSKVALGATVGGGLEAMLSPNWLLRGEYRFSDYGKIGNTDFRGSPSGDLTVDYDVKIKTHTATFGLAYKFGDSSTSPLSAMGAMQSAPSAASWTGAYIGAGVGARATQSNASLAASSVAINGSPAVDGLAGCGCFLDNTFSGTSVRFNPYLGYNWQFAPQWVVGIEGDFGWANQKATLSGQLGPGSGFFGSGGSTNDSYSVATKWDASLRARLGYVINPAMMIYGTAGPAWMKVEEASRCDTAVQAFATAPGFSGLEVGACAAGSATPVNLTQSTVKPGFTVGAGGEARLWNGWLVRAEYRYSDFGTTTFTDARSCDGTTVIPSGTIGCHYTEVNRHDIRIRTNTAMFGLAYKFD